MKNSLELKTVINFVLDAKTKTSIQNYISTNSYKYSGDILSDLILTGNIEVLKKIPIYCLRFHHCMKVAVTFGDDGLLYLSKSKYWGDELTKQLLGKKLEAKPEKDSIYYSQSEKRYYLTKYIFANGVKALNTSYEILSFKNIKDLYRANNNNLIGVNLIDVPISKKAKTELDFTGAYVLRKDISLYPNAIAVDEIICSKKFHKKKIMQIMLLLI